MRCGISSNISSNLIVLCDVLGLAIYCLIVHLSLYVSIRDSKAPKTNSIQSTIPYSIGESHQVPANQSSEQPSVSGQSDVSINVQPSSH